MPRIQAKIADGNNGVVLARTAVSGMEGPKEGPKVNVNSLLIQENYRII